MKIIIASDHAGFANKQTLIQQLKAFGFDMIDAGTFTDGSCHYPEYALAAAERVAAKEAPFGVLIALNRSKRLNPTFFNCSSIWVLRSVLDSKLMYTTFVISDILLIVIINNIQ